VTFPTVLWIRYSSVYRHTKTDSPGLVLHQVEWERKWASYLQRIAGKCSLSNQDIR